MPPAAAAEQASSSSSPPPPPPPPPPSVGAAPAGEESLLLCVRRTGSWRLLLILFVYASGLLVLVPVLPDLVTNDFAKRRAGHSIRCQDFPPGEAPAACQDAHSDVVFWSSWSGFAQNTVLAVIITPALGSLSDLHGRKPFILLAQAVSCAASAVVLLHLTLGVPLQWYYVVTAFTGSITSVTPSISYMADVTPPRLRAPCFGLILAVFSLAVLAGPPIGAALPPAAAPVVAIAVALGCMVATAAALPESLPEATAAAARELRARDGAAAGPRPAAALAATWRALAILRRSPLFRRLTLVLMLSAVVSESSQDLLVQYLQLKLGFGAADISHLYVIFGGGVLLVQGALFQPILGLVGECRLLALGLAASAAQQLSLALAGSKGAALGAVALGSLGSVAFPTVSSIKANNAGEHEQGAVQGALAGARALASGVGPLLFAFVFALTTRTDSPLPFFPGASFLLGSALMVGAVGLTLALPADAGGHAGSLFAAARRARRPLEAAEEGGGEGAESKSLLGAPSEGGSGLGKRASLDGLTTGAPLPLL